METGRSTAATDAERIFAEVLADVLRVDRVSVDSHFFDELGADSWVRAHCCARVRKRGDLPSVSMKDIYRYPTIRSRAAALADVAPSPPRPAVPAAIEPPTPTSTREYILCGVLQGLFFLASSYLAVLAIEEQALQHPTEDVLPRAGRCRRLDRRWNRRPGRAGRDVRERRGQASDRRIPVDVLHRDRRQVPSLPHSRAAMGPHPRVSAELIKEMT